MFSITITHTLTVKQTYWSHSPTIQQAEGFAAMKWKKYPTNASDREHTIVSCGPVAFSTTDYGAAK